VPEPSGGGYVGGDWNNMIDWKRDQRKKYAGKSNIVIDDEDEEEDETEKLLK